MSEIAIQVDRLSKLYQLGSARSGSLRESLGNKFSRGQNGQKAEFWALKDVSFQVKAGEALGIIGRNGAGKSTLLKIFSRITQPTRGRIEINGRLSSLLEVGTGFHPELTGRENIFLNGTILGMKRGEVKAKFDEIVAFSGVEKFIDTPVKRYSSGMYVRLAFSVAAHLEPEILIIDEVLAVGDSVFQKKCIDKMTDVCRDGRTILFVSHNFSAVKALCTHALLLQEGRLLFEGGVEETLDRYNNEVIQVGQSIDLAGVTRKGYAHELIFDRVTFSQMPVPFGEPIQVKVQLKATGKTSSFEALDFGLNITDKYHNCIIHCSNRFIHANFDHTSDEQTYFFEIENNMKPGIYNVTLFLRAKDIIQDFLIDVLSIEIAEGNPYNYNDTKLIHGSVLPRFSIQQLP
jgi:lipopolysaccharide transport system ATP-binding protein